MFLADIYPRAIGFAKTVFILFYVIFLSACSSLPQALVSPNKALITDYQTWLQSDPSIANEVRLGGVIANVTNLKHRTKIEVVNMPINSAGKPDLSAEPEGRFFAYVEGYIEPVTFSSGRLVTLLGNTQGEELGRVGDYSYNYRVLNVTGWHLWRVVERVVIDRSGSYLYPCYGLSCRSSKKLSSSEGRVIQQVK